MSTYYVDPGNPNVDPWQASTAYSLGDRVYPTTAGDSSRRYIYECTTAGTSGASEPTWVDTPESTTNDNTVVWTCKAPDSWAEAILDIQGAIDLVAAGDTVYCRGTQTMGSGQGQIDCDGTSGDDASGMIKFIGVNASGVRDGTLFTLYANGETNCLGTGGQDYLYWENFKFNGALENGVDRDAAAGENWVFNNCEFVDNTGSGVFGGNDCHEWEFYKCKFNNNGAKGVINPGNANFFAFCEFIGNTDDGIFGFYGTDYLVAYGCIFHANGGNSDLNTLNRMCILINCVVDKGSGIGVHSRGAGSFLTVLGCRITNYSGATDIGIDGNSNVAFVGWTYFHNNNDDMANDASLIEIFEDGNNTNESDTGADDGYNNRAADDFNLKSDAQLRRVQVEVP